jgi:phage protein U
MPDTPLSAMATQRQQLSMLHGKGMIGKFCILRNEEVQRYSFCRGMGCGTPS